MKYAEENPFLHQELVKKNIQIVPLHLKSKVEIVSGSTVQYISYKNMYLFTSSNTTQWPFFKAFNNGPSFQENVPASPPSTGRSAPNKSEIS